MVLGSYDYADDCDLTEDEARAYLLDHPDIAQALRDAAVAAHSVPTTHKYFLVLAIDEKYDMGYDGNKTHMEISVTIDVDRRASVYVSQFGEDYDAYSRWLIKQHPEFEHMVHVMRGLLRPYVCVETYY